MNRLEELGWTADLAAALTPEDMASREPARVVEEHRSRYLVGSASGDIPAVLSGRMRHLAAEPDERPAVGDWVAISRREGDGLALVDRVLPRRSALRRKVAGRQTTAQIVAANLDTVFVVTSLNLELNLRRLERYLTAVWESGAEPVVVLTKSDLCSDADSRRAEVEFGAPGFEAPGHG